MKKVVLFLLLVSMVLQGINRGLVYVQFQLNREYIAKNLCVKKEVKNNCCQGSCQLSKKLGEDSQTKNTSPNSSLKVAKEFWMLYVNQQKISLDLKPTISNRVLFPYNRQFTNGSLTSLFHPPIEG